MIEEIKRALEIPEVKAEVMKLIEPEINEIVTKMVAGLPSSESELTDKNHNGIGKNSLGVHNDNQQPQTPPPQQPPQPPQQPPKQPINFDTGQPIGSGPAQAPVTPQQAQLEQLGQALFNPQVLQSIIPYIAQALGFAPKSNNQNPPEEVFEKMKSNYLFFKDLEGQNDSSNETLLLISNITKALTGKNDSPVEVMGATVDQMLASNNRGKNDSK